MSTDDVLRELRAASWPLGYFVGRHQHLNDPNNPRCFYVRRLKEHPDSYHATLLKYANADMVRDYLKIAAGDFAN